MTPVIAPIAPSSDFALRASGVAKVKKPARTRKSKDRLPIAGERLNGAARAANAIVDESPETAKSNRKKTKRGNGSKSPKKPAKSRVTSAINGTARRVNGSAVPLVNGRESSNGHATKLDGNSANRHSSGQAAAATRKAGGKPARRSKSRTKSGGNETPVIVTKAGKKQGKCVRNGNRRAAAKGQVVGSGPAIHTPTSDRKLIDQSLGGVTGAWDVLHHRCHQPLLTAIRAIIGPRSADPNLVDELAARVWYAVVRDQGRLLDRFDPRRECTLTTYLALIAKDEASRFFRSEKRRRMRETAVATSDSKSASNSISAAGAATITIQEFVATLTPAEKTFYDEITVRNGHAANRKNGSNGTEKSNGNGHGQSNGRSQANEWQLNHRVRRKLERFLTN